MSAKKALTPPLTLYRQILRAHRVHLPSQFRILGDGYVKAEFHRHKDVDNPLYIVGFIEQWQEYLDHVVSSSPKQQEQKQQAHSVSSTVSQTSTTPNTNDASREATLEKIVAAGKPFGKKLDPSLLDKMTDQQLGQLYELRKETKGLQSASELEELAKEEAQLLEKVAEVIPSLKKAAAASS
ncbi:acetate non-utilizing protein 9 [Podila minutissima]|uniref:Succinate dehydrogenase assembly factor 3 n=1 Tax=Podila minutissima TaxID=64525 RepID=A0A9P5SPW2_9FUNG|nr:acetate non-utilizing protein 9 [Podila minutissima]